MTRSDHRQLTDSAEEHHLLPRPPSRGSRDDDRRLGWAAPRTAVDVVPEFVPPRPQPPRSSPVATWPTTARLPFFVAMELVAMLLIARYAWTWSPEREAQSLGQGSALQGSIPSQP